MPATGHLTIEIASKRFTAMIDWLKIVMLYGTLSIFLLGSGSTSRAQGAELQDIADELVDDPNNPIHAKKLPGNLRIITSIKTSHACLLRFACKQPHDSLLM